MKKIIIALVVLLMFLVACSPNATKTSNNIKASRAFTSEESIGGYVRADFDKFNSPAEENGLGDTKIYVDGVITEVESSSNGIVAVLKTDDGKSWLVVLGDEKTFDIKICESLKDKKIRAFGKYIDFSEVKKMPAFLFEKASVVSTGEVYYILELTGYDIGKSEPKATATPTAAPTPAPTPEPTPEPTPAPTESPKVNSPKISKAEFDQISNGMSYEQVAGIIGSAGELLSESGSPGDAYYTVMYSWNGEGSTGASANFMFQGGKLQNKAQFGLK